MNSVKFLRAIIFNEIPLVATSEVHIKKFATLLNIYYFTSLFQEISLNSLLLFIKTGLINTILLSIKLYI